MENIVSQREQVKRLYERVMRDNSSDPDGAVIGSTETLKRVVRIEKLEKLTKKQFGILPLKGKKYDKNTPSWTEDFYKKMEHWFTRAERYTKIGARLRKAREEHYWSSQTLAKYLGISVSYLSQMENDLKPINKEAMNFVKKAESNSSV